MNIRSQTWRKPGLYNIVGQTGILGKMSGTKPSAQFRNVETNNEFSRDKVTRVEKIKQPQSFAIAKRREMIRNARDVSADYYRKRNLDLLEQKIKIKPVQTTDMRSAKRNFLPHRKIDKDFTPSKVSVTGDTEEHPLRPVTSFSSLRKISSIMLVQALQHIWKDPTPIQSHGWTSLLAERDTILLSPPGSGKSGAYLVPCIVEVASFKKKNNIVPDDQSDKKTNKSIKEGITLRPRSLIIVPTVELAIQLSRIGSYLSNPCGVLTGQIASPSGCVQEEIDILIATPEAIKTFSKKGLLDWSGLQSVVVDEADTFLGNDIMRELIETIFMRIGRKTQRVFCASSWRSQSGEAALQLLQEPVLIRVEESVQLQRIQHSTHVVAPKNEAAFLAEMFCEGGLPIDKRQKYIIFCNDVMESCLVYDLLQSVLPSDKVLLLHDDLLPYQRTMAIDHMSDTDCRILVCTDIVSRGIDFPQVNVVINFGIPSIPETLYQRIGRTARFDRYGAVHTLVSSSTPKYLLQMIRSYIKDSEISDAFYNLIRDEREKSTFVKHQEIRAERTAGIDDVF